jgi:hypothetical protein
MQQQATQPMPPPDAAILAWARGDITGTEARRLIALIPPTESDAATDYAIMQQLF